MNGNERTEERERMARAVARNTGIEDERLLAALRRVPRHAFVPAEQALHAYEDRALPIGQDQTISQPSMIALMFDALAPEPNDRALEVGAGSGYAAALLATLVERVDAVEILPNLAERARATLARLGVSNVRIHRGTGERGLRDAAPFDVILVSAGARNVPPALVDQLAPNGRIAIPVGDDDGQHLLVGKRKGTGEVVWDKRMACMFVPLVTSDRSAEPNPVRPSRPYAT
ncbi:MAG TPA: protein-L-isoaspartate(D-aspartate) O-methyltransferase [Polyangiaceae bacterium]